VRILTRTDAPFAGVVRVEEGKTYVVPDSDTRISYEVLRGAVSAQAGEKVLAKVFSRGSRQSAHKVKILQVFGSADRAAVCAQAIITARGLPVEFPDPVLAEAEEVAAGGIHPKELEARLDLRGEPIFYH
jgi:ribonuclease R